jgi:hypothetical protein
LKSIRYILILFFFQQNLIAQIEIVGKIEYCRSKEFKSGHLETFSEKTFKSLNSREHYLKINQGKYIIEKQTNSNGIFKIELVKNEPLTIQVYKKESIYNKTFYYNPEKYTINDTIVFRISERKLYLNIDSLQAPKFYKKYNEKIAELDFKNGNARILGSGNWLTEEIVEKREKLSEKHNFKYEYILGGLTSTATAERRIAYRYNEKMKKLIGIKNVW